MSRINIFDMSDSTSPSSSLNIHAGQCENFIIMDVGEPVTISAKESFGRTFAFTSYLIRVETNFPTFSSTFSAVRRRYSEFCWLKEKLTLNHPNEIVPPLPPKKYLRIINFNSKVIQERCIGLSKFLKRVLETPAFLMDSSLLFFIQSDLSVQEMEEKVRGEDSSFHTSEEITVDQLGHDEEASVSISNLSIIVRRRVSVESDECDRISSDGSGYDSSVPNSNGDSGHFDVSGSGSNASSFGRRNPKQLAKPRPTRVHPNSHISHHRLNGIMMNSPMACYMIGQT